MVPAVSPETVARVAPASTSWVFSAAADVPAKVDRRQREPVGHVPLAMETVADADVAEETTGAPGVQVGTVSSAKETVTGSSAVPAG